MAHYFNLFSNIDLYNQTCLIWFNSFVARSHACPQPGTPMA